MNVMQHDKSYLTAISRKGISRPMKYLQKHHLLTAPVLDYGCGRGMDADYFGFAKYDPHFFPDKKPLHRKWPIITCHYVLNVLRPDEINEAIQKVLCLLTKKGKAYFSVRRNIKTEGVTSKGTRQYNVVLPFKKLVENSSYCIYEAKSKRKS